MNPRPVKPGQVRNALLNALERHGVAPTTAESIWYDLVTGNDPRPDHLPETFTFKGTPLVWPAGRHTRAIQPEELRTLNKALRASTYTVVEQDGEKVTIKADLLDGDDTAMHARWAYEGLYRRTQQPGFDNTTIVEDRIAAVVADATRERDTSRDPDALNLTLNLAVASMTLDTPAPEGEHPCRKTKTVHGPHVYVRARALTQCPGIPAAQEDARTALEREIDQMMADLDSI